MDAAGPVDAPRFPPIAIPIADLKIEWLSAPVASAWAILFITHLPTGERLGSVHRTRDELVALLGTLRTVQNHYAKDRAS